jgi:caa(3)-type oxidase subunit IV
MSADHFTLEPPVEHENPDSHGSVFQRIMVPFIILFALTALEFLIAFTMKTGPLRVTIFVLLTLVKAFYIVSFFMHLKFERTFLRWTIVLPMLFVVYLIVLIFLEGGYVYERAPRKAEPVTKTATHSTQH